MLSFLNRLFGRSELHKEIEARRRVEEALRQSEERYRELLEKANDIIYTHDLEGNFTSANEAVERILGYRPEEFVLMNMAQVLPAEHLDRARQMVQRKIAQGDRTTYELDVLAKDGCRVTLEISSRLIYEAGRMVGVQGIARDITERKRTQESLRASEDRFRLLVMGVKEYGILMLDPQGHVASWNSGAERITGYHAEEIIGQHFSRFYPAEAIERGWPQQELARVMSEGRLEDEGWRMRKDGSRFWANVVFTSLRDNSGDLQGFSKVVRDLTERKRTEERIQAFARQLERSNKDLEQFALVASHDLQEPLRKIQAFGDRLQAKFGATLGEQGQEYVERMRSSAARMQALINDLLRFSRLTTKEPHFAPVDLGQIAREALSDLEDRLQQTGGCVEIGVLPTIEADPTQMRQLFLNLIGNALKFHRPGEPPVVKVDAKAVQGANKSSQTEADLSCEITVADNGIGFADTYLKRIFEVFQRLHGRQEYDGTGMGLPICKTIVERHGGSITARSEPGKGATFIVTLPLKQAKEETNQWQSTRSPLPS